jgi:hypothetical protein
MLRKFARENPRFNEVMSEYKKPEDKKTRMEKIMEKDKKDRTREDKEYLKEVMDRYYNNISEDNIAYNYGIPPDFESDEKYVDYKVIEGKHKVVAVKSRLGGGKSYAVNEYIKKHQDTYKNIVVITPRRSYARSCTERLRKATGLDFKCYLDLKEQNIIEPYIVIQAESLWKLDMDLYCGFPTLVVADEIEAFLSQLTVKTTHGEKHSINIRHWEKLVKGAQKMVLLDAFISRKTISTFRNMGRKPVFHNYTKKAVQQTFFQSTRLTSFYDQIEQSLINGEKIVIVCTSRKRLCQSPMKPDNTVDEGILPMIRRKFPHKRIKEYHSQYKSDDMTDIQNSWKDCDVLAYTGTITVGLNFDEKDVFNRSFMYVSSCSENYIRDVFQGLFRVRHFSERDLVLFLDDRTFNFKNYMTHPIEHWKIREVLKDKYSSETNFRSQLSEKWKETPKWLLELYINNLLEANMSIMRTEDLIHYFLDECNYIERYDDEEEEILERLEIATTDLNVRYEDIKELTLTEKQKLIKKAERGEGLTDMERLQLRKYSFDTYDTISGMTLEERSLIFPHYISLSKRIIFNLRCEKGIHAEEDRRNMEQLNINEISLARLIDKDSFIHFSQGRALQLSLIYYITTKLGIRSSHDYNTEIKRGYLEQFLEDFMTDNNIKKYNGAFKMRYRGKHKDLNSGIKYLNMILRNWAGETELKSCGRKRQGGRRVDDYRVKVKTCELYEKLQKVDMRKRHRLLS